MKTLFGWGLALAAVVVGWQGWGWPGVALAVTVTVFWLLLEFSRSLRMLRDVGNAPVGSVASAVMFNAKLQTGLRMPQLLKLTRSLGRQVAPLPDEVWLWADGGGDEVRVTLRGGRVTRWELVRAAPPDATPGA